MSYPLLPPGAKPFCYVGPQHYPTASIPNVHDSFIQWANAIWGAGAQGPQQILKLVQDASFINYHWMLNKIGPYTEYCYFTRAGKIGPCVQINDNYSEIIFGYYHNNMLEGPFIKVKYSVKETYYMSGFYQQNYMHGICQRTFPNGDKREDQFVKDVLHGVSTIDTKNVTETVTFLHGKKEGVSILMDKVRGVTVTRNYRQGQLLHEILAVPQFPDMELFRLADKDWVLRCRFKNCPQDLPLEWYLESLALKFAQVMKQPLHPFVNKPMQEPLPLPVDFVGIEDGAKLWESLKPKTKQFALKFLAEGYDERSFEKFNKKVTINQEKTQIAFELARQRKETPRKRVSIQIDILKNEILFQSSDGHFLLHGGRVPHFEEVTNEPVFPVAHRITLAQETIYYQTLCGKKQERECRVRSNGDQVIDQLDRSILKNPKWPGVEIHIERLPGKSDEFCLVWDPKEKPAEKSIQGYLKALFAPPPPAPDIPAAAVIPPTPGTASVLDGLLALANVADPLKEPQRQKRPLEDSHVPNPAPTK